MKKYLILFIITLLVFLFFRLPYRNFIYSNNIFDFFIADTAPNFLTIYLFVFFKKSQKIKHNNLMLVVFSFLGLTIYEFFLQTHIYKGARIDLLDILASLIASITVYFICEKIDEIIVSKKT